MVNPGMKTTISDLVAFTSVPTSTLVRGAIWYRNGAAAAQQAVRTINQDLAANRTRVSSPLWRGTMIDAASDIPTVINSINVSHSFAQKDLFEGIAADTTLYRISPPLIGTFSVSVSVFPRSGTINYPAINS